MKQRLLDLLDNLRQRDDALREFVDRLESLRAHLGLDIEECVKIMKSIEDAPDGTVYP